MKQAKWQRRLTAPLVAALLFSVFAPVALLAQDTDATQQTKAAEVTGVLTGGQFAKIWLGLTPINVGAVTVRAEWNRLNAAQSGLGFYILDESNLAAVVSGAPLPANNLGVGSSDFYLNGPSNVQGANFRPSGPAYTVVVFNDSDTDANFTLSAVNGLFVDDADQVRVVGEVETPAAIDAVMTTVAAAPAATEAAAATPAAAATDAVTPSVAAVPAGPVRATTMQGELPEQFDQHFLALEPEIKDSDISLELTYDPQDSTELARRINFWVLDQDGFNRYQAGDSAGSVAIAAGSKSFMDSDTSNKRVAAFKAVGFGPYTIIVQNNSRVPATYNLGVTGGVLSDDSAQTLTAQQAGATAPAAAAASTTTDTGAATTTAADAGSGGVGKPGGTYVVKAGDTLAIIARDIYGDFRLYQQLCAFNNIANCNAIEIGQTINLPTTAQIGAATTTAVAATPAVTTAVAATPATTTTVAATPATTVAVTDAVTTTAAVTTTTAATTTAAARPAATTVTTVTTATTATTTAAGTIVDIAENNGNFSILLEALGATDLDAALGGSGPFTVFAPTDAAFTSLLSGNGLTKDQLLQAKELADILQYHVLSGKVLAADVTDGLKATTLQGKPVTFEVKDGKVFINGAEIVTTDIQASNGVIHAIDAVILPPQ